MSRKVRCQDCGHTWESDADSPRCSDPNDQCGRSRNVEPVGSGSDGDGSGDGDDQESQDDSGGRTPFFESVQQRTGFDPQESRTPETGTPDESEDAEGEAEADAMAVPEVEPEDVRPILATVLGGPPAAGEESIPGLASQRRGDHWELREHEMQSLSRAYARVGNKWAPYLLAEYTVEGLALITTFAVIGPRLAEDRRQQAEDEGEETGEEPTGNVRSETQSMTGHLATDGEESTEIETETSEAYGAVSNA